MSNRIREEEIEGIVQLVLSDLNGEKHIDTLSIENKPDKTEVQTIVKHLFRLIFPGFYRDRTVKIYHLKNSIAVTVEDIFFHLHRQIMLALDFFQSGNPMTEEECQNYELLKNHPDIGTPWAEEDREREAYRICRAFFEKIPMIREYVESDLLAAYDGDPAAKCLEEIVLAYPGLMAIMVYRLAHELYLLGVPVIPRIMTEFAHSETGVDIHPGATIGKSFFIDHATGIVVGETSIIGNNVKIYQGVTIGALSTRGGQKLAGKKRHPTIEDNVTIYSGASILGGDTVIGANSVIGGNTFITSSVPADTRVSMKNPEMEYKTKGDKRVTKEIEQSEAWFYII
ncbi:MAG: serine O-acetyltransferase [Eubacterium sp.]|nr:serine O-acetyltransferase [Eubacterium sp.]